MASPSAPLIDLLGDTRGRIVETLRSGAASVADLAQQVGISEMGVRKHLQVLERDDLVSTDTVKGPGRGRPKQQYALTEKARRLFPDNSAELANELLSYLSDEHGRSELQRFLRWRSERHSDRYAAALEGLDTVDERVQRLAGVLADDGFAASAEVITTPDGATVLELRQEHCAIKAVAEEHPELCAYEASTFKKLLGAAKLSRRQTIAGGASACICHITATSDDTGAPSQ